MFHQPVFKKIASAGLSSLRQKGYQILVKNWIFDDPFHEKGWLLVNLVPGMIQPSGSVKILIKWGCWGCWGHWGCWGCWGHWGCRGFKDWKITTGTSESSRFLNLALFWWFEKKNWVYNLKVSSWILATFLLEAVEARRCYFFENWLMKHKWVTLVTMQTEIYYQNSQFFYPSELFTLDHTFMRHPVIVKK